MSAAQGTADSACSLCGKSFPTGPERLAHFLVGHGPQGRYIGPARKRKRVRARLPRLHRRLEEMGYSETEAHRILQAVQEELRGTGVV